MMTLLWAILDEVSEYNPGYFDLIVTSGFDGKHGGTNGAKTKAFQVTCHESKQ